MIKEHQPSAKKTLTIDANQAVAHVAYRVNEIIVIYPITPSSPMAEWCDQWAAESVPNIWGTVPAIMEMQSEGGAAGAVHGALQTGSLTTTFTASQGLLLMLPNMYKIAGELTPAVFHVAARALAYQGLSIFGDHSDVMSARSTGFVMLCSSSVQEAPDMALIAHSATLLARLPFMHFFDGFRTSHELARIELISDDQIRAMIDLGKVHAHRARALSPEHPVLRGTAQNPDVNFQARETVNAYYAACPDIVQDAMDRFAALTGRQYRLFEYEGHPDADRVIVLMGSGVGAAQETVEHLIQQGEKVGLLKVRLYRPFDAKRFMEALPATVSSVAILDRTKEPGSAGEPLYLDCLAALEEGIENGYGRLKQMPKVVGGRYGLSSKEFTPAMVKAVFDHLREPRPKKHFTIGIDDDVTHTSLPFDADFSTESPKTFRALFYGLGSDGTVGANKNSIKIISENTDFYSQAYFVYDSKKAGAMTVSHLRFGPTPIRSSYLISRAHFIGCHQWSFVERFALADSLEGGGTFLLNSPYPPDMVWSQLPRSLRTALIAKKARLFTIDAYSVARDAGMKQHINTVMQTCFFAISGVIPQEQALAAIRTAIKKSYSKKGDEVVQLNLRAVDQTLAHLHEIPLPAEVGAGHEMPPAVPAEAPAFVQKVLAPMIAGRGESLPVSALPIDGTYPTGTTQWEKRNIGTEIPVWDPAVCIQCNKCVIACPHAVIRAKVYDRALLKDAPAHFKSIGSMDRDWKDRAYTLQVAAEDCTGCGICVDVCPAKNKSETRLKAINMSAQVPLRDSERTNWDFFLKLPDPDRAGLKNDTIRHQQLQRPLFEFSSACAGCGETPYLKLLSQLFGDRALIANATGCSSIYGGNLPTTPWTRDANGRGPAWANSLFEDNAEFGLGFRLSLNKQRQFAAELASRLAPQVGEDLVRSLLAAEQAGETAIIEQRKRVQLVREALAGIQSAEARQLETVLDALVKKSVWIVGGDGWAYDIGFGGLDHVLSSGHKVNVLVLDTEVYSNTGGQMSKSTPRAAVAKFAAAGKPSGKKDLGLIAMTYGHIFVASVAMGARDEHTLKTFLEAEAYPGPSLIIAYSQCVAHGIDMSKGMQIQKAAMESGHWPLYRYNPLRAKEGKNPLTLDSAPPKGTLADYMYRQNRFKMLTKSNPEEAKRLLEQAEEAIRQRWRLYEHLAAYTVPSTPTPAADSSAGGTVA